MSTENDTKTLIQPRSLIADALVNAAAEISGLRPEQITTIHAGAEEITIGYLGAKPGLSGAAGRVALQTYDTQTGKLLDDRLVDDPAELARSRDAVESRRRSLFAQDPR